MSKASQSTKGLRSESRHTAHNEPKQRELSTHRCSQSSDDELESRSLIKQDDGTSTKPRGIASAINVQILTFLLMFLLASLFVYSFVNFVWSAILGASVRSKPIILKDTIFRRVPFLTLTLNLAEMAIFVFAFFALLKYDQLIGLKNSQISRQQIKRVYLYIRSIRWLIILLIMSLIGKSSLTC